MRKCSDVGAWETGPRSIKLIVVGDYARKNTLIYSTHLPFMLDLRHPERIKVISETGSGAVVLDDFSGSQPEAKLTLQAALGMSGRTSYLVAARNLVVEGADDFWIVTELSNLLIRSGRGGLPEDLYVTAAGGASEAAYIAALMIGQELEVVVLLDSDAAGGQAADKLTKNWLTAHRPDEVERRRHPRDRERVLRPADRVPVDLAADQDRATHGSEIYPPPAGRGRVRL